MVSLRYLPSLGPLALARVRGSTEVYGDGRMPAGQRGIASATGSRGTYVNCEYALTDTNRGTGACVFSNGATYQAHFGS